MYNHTLVIQPLDVELLVDLVDDPAAAAGSAASGQQGALGVSGHHHVLHRLVPLGGAGVWVASLRGQETHALLRVRCNGERMRQWFWLRRQGFKPRLHFVF